MPQRCDCCRSIKAATITDSGSAPRSVRWLADDRLLDRERLASMGVASCEYGLDLCDGHLQAPEPPDHLSRWDLLLDVVAVPGCGVDLAWLQQPDIVVVAQRLDTQVRRPRV